MAGVALAEGIGQATGLEHQQRLHRQERNQPVRITLGARSAHRQRDGLDDVPAAEQREVGAHADEHWTVHAGGARWLIVTHGRSLPGFARSIAAAFQSIPAIDAGASVIGT